MKVWQAILIGVLVLIIFLIGFNYIKVINNFNDLITEKEVLAAEKDRILSDYNKLENQNKNNKEDNNYLENPNNYNKEDNNFLENEISKKDSEDNTDENFIAVVENNVINYEFFDFKKNKEENLKTYIEDLGSFGAMEGTYIPIFSDPNELEESYLEQLFLRVLLRNNSANLYGMQSGIIIHKKLIEKVFDEFFGEKYEVSKLNLEKLSIFPLDDYEDIYTFSYSGEWNEGKDDGFVIIDSKENEELVEVTLIEYCIRDEIPFLMEGESCKRTLLNNKGETIKEYEIECLENYMKMTYNGKTITYDDIEKEVLNNKDKFEKKKITFKYSDSKINIVSCEIVK